MIYYPSGVCTQMMNIDLDGRTIKDIQFIGGCSGNTSGIASLLRGMDIDFAIERLEGIKCGFKDTSCPDQLAKALRQYKEEKNL